MCAILRMVWVLDLLHSLSEWRILYCHLSLQEEAFVMQVIVSKYYFILGFFMEKIEADRLTEGLGGDRSDGPYLTKASASFFSDTTCPIFT